MSKGHVFQFNKKAMVWMFAAALGLIVTSSALVSYGTCAGTVTAGQTWTVDDDGDWADYHTIQAALNNANEGDVILVFPGTYYEHVIVNKPVSLVGEDRGSVIVDGADSGTVFEVTADRATIENFTIQHGKEGVAVLSDGNNITNNLVVYNVVGVLLDFNCKGNTVSHNTISASMTDGIYGDRSGSNRIAHNNISLNRWRGIFLYASEPSVIDGNLIQSNNLDGMYIRYSSNNTITGNLVFSNSPNGIYIYSDEDPIRPSGLSRGNGIENNVILNNSCGVRVTHRGTDSELAGNELQRNYLAYNDNALNISGSNGNLIYHNSFVENSVGVFISESHSNTWDAGYLMGGNYWSDHNSTDSYWGPLQNETGSDGIVDNPYQVFTNLTQDRYPYMRLNGWEMQPELSVSSPLNSTLYRHSSLPLILETNKPVSISYSLDNQPNITITKNSVLTDLVRGVHNITIYATDAFANKASSKIRFTVTFRGDLSLDGIVNIIDVSMVAYSFGHTPGSDRWNPDADLNNDSIINIVDIATVAREFGSAIS